MSKQGVYKRIQRRLAAKIRSLIRATLIPFGIATLLFMFAVVSLTAMVPATKQPKNELSRRILTILR